MKFKKIIMIKFIFSIIAKHVTDIDLINEIVKRGGYAIKLNDYPTVEEDEFYILE